MAGVGLICALPYILYTTGMKIVVADVPLVQSPPIHSKDVNDITNVNAHSKSFDFLLGEPELYSVFDLKKKYARGRYLKITS